MSNKSAINTAYKPYENVKHSILIAILTKQYLNFKKIKTNPCLLNFVWLT